MTAMVSKTSYYREKVAHLKTGNHHRRKPHTSRKEARKLERQSQKERKAEYFKAASGVKRSAPSAEQGGSPPRKKTKIETMPTQDVSRLPSSSVPLKKSKPSITTPSKKTTLQKMASQSKSSVAKPRRETEEDAYIAYLEGKLGYAKGKRKDTGDGLDGVFPYLLACFLELKLSIRSPGFCLHSGSPECKVYCDLLTLSVVNSCFAGNLGQRNISFF